MEAKTLVVDELNPKLNITRVVDTGGLQKVEDFLKRTETFVLDTETNVEADFTRRKLRTIQVGDRNEQYVIDLLPFAGSTSLLKQQGWKTAPSWSLPITEVLTPYLHSDKHVKVGVRLQFDYEMLRWNLGIRAYTFYDCFLAEQLIHSGRVPFYTKDFWGMENMIERYCRLIISKNEQTTFNLESPITEEQWLYAGLDARLPLAIQSAQQVILAKAGLEEAARVENGAIMSFGDMHLNGIFLNKSAWLARVNKIKEQHAAHVKTLDSHFLPIVGRKEDPSGQYDLEALESVWRNEKDREQRAINRKAFEEARRNLKVWKDNSATWEGEAAINYAATPQVKGALHQMGFNEKLLPDTNDRTLSRLADFPVIKALQAYRATAKNLSTYGEDWPDKYINEATGRIHSNVNQIGAETGRSSSTNPNMFNLPQDEEVRACFQSRPGYGFITEDMAGAELRIVAELSGEPVWLEAFEKGWDVHSLCAEMMYRDKWKDGTLPDCAYYHTGDHQKCKCPVHKKLRNDSKACNFLTLYGGEAGKLADDLGVEKKVAQEILNLFRATFSVLTAYLNKSAQSAKRYLEARTMSGRRRLFTMPTRERAVKYCAARNKNEGDKREITQYDLNRAMFMISSGIEREGKNTPIQGSNADIAKEAMGLMWLDLEPKYGGELVNFVYDEFDLEAPTEHLKACMEFVGSCIERAGARYMKKVKMEWEGNISDKWSK